MASSGFTVQNGSVNCYGTAIVFIYTKDGAHDFCTASTHGPATPRISPLQQGEGDFVILKPSGFKVIDAHPQLRLV